MNTSEGTHVAQAESERNAAAENWAAYQNGLDAGHLKYLESAKKHDNYFVGDQWEDGDVAALDSEGRPHQTVNLVLSTINAAMGQHIKNRQELTFVPKGGNAADDVATVLTQVVKHIEVSNQSKWVEQTVFADGLIEDRGYFDIRIDFSDNVFGEVRETALNPRDVVLPPGASEYDPKTWPEVITTRWLTIDEISVLYGKAKADEVRAVAMGGNYGYDSIEYRKQTFGNDNGFGGAYIHHTPQRQDAVHRVRIIERQHRKLASTRYFVDPQQGDMRQIPENWDEERVQQFVAAFNLSIIEKPERKVRWTVSADSVLLYDGWSLYKNFTVIPFFPNFRRGRPFGLVKNLCSPQDTLNKVTSQELHVVNTTANSGWTFESGTLVNMDAVGLAAAGAKTGLVLEHAKGTNAPQKILPNQVPAGLSQVALKAEGHFNTISGIEGLLYGSGSTDKSGRAMREGRDTGAMQMETVFDNLAKTRFYRGEQILSLIQQFYTEERVIRVTLMDELGDDVQQDITVNQATPAGAILNDLTLGEYTVNVSSIQDSDSVQDIVFDQARELREIGVPIPNYVMVESSRLPNRKAVAEIVKRLENLAEPTEEEAQIASMQQQLQMMMLENTARELAAKAAEREANAQLLMAKTQTELQQPQLEAGKLGSQLRADMERLAAELQQKREEMQTRLRISAEKNAANTMTAQIGSMTKRVDFASREREKIADIAARTMESSAKLAAAKETAKAKPAAKPKPKTKR